MWLPPVQLRSRVTRSTNGSSTAAEMPRMREVGVGGAVTALDLPRVRVVASPPKARAAAAAAAPDPTALREGPGAEVRDGGVSPRWRGKAQAESPLCLGWSAARTRRTSNAGRTAGGLSTSNGGGSSTMTSSTGGGGAAAAAGSGVVGSESPAG